MGGGTLCRCLWGGTTLRQSPSTASYSPGLFTTRNPRIWRCDVGGLNFQRGGKQGTGGRVVEERVRV